MSNIEYTEQYIEKVFYLWYDGGRKESNAFVNLLPKNEEGITPSKFTIIKWKSTRGWVERADALDAEASRAIDNTVIAERVEMYKKQKIVADQLINKGMKFLNEKGIQSDASAIRAIDLGFATQRVSTGIAEAYAKYAKMSDEQLSATLVKLLGKKDDDVIDAIVEPDTNVDTEVE